MKTPTLKIIIPCSKTYEFIQIDDIIRCEALQNYTKIILKSKETLISSCNLGLYTKALYEYQFFNCHKSHLINNQHIQRYHKEGQLEMSDSSRVPVSRRKKEEFINKVLKKNNILANHLKR